jgi:hypothetical protein
MQLTCGVECAEAASDRRWEQTTSAAAIRCREAHAAPQKGFLAVGNVRAGYSINATI